MVYAKRRYRRRGTRRTSRKLSNYNIATRTSARAQASQIYSLKRRINVIQRLTRPQVITLVWNTQNSTTYTDKSINISGNARGIIPWGYTTSAATLNAIYPPTDTKSSVSVNATGHITFARLHSYTLQGNLTLVSGSYPETVRIVIVQLKTSRDSTVAVDDVFQESNSGANLQVATYGPLQTGLARTVKVLSDKKYRLDLYHPQVQIKTRLRYLLSYYRDSDSITSTAATTQTQSETQFKGSIMVFYSAARNDGDDESSSSINMCLTSKLAYSQ